VGLVVTAALADVLSATGLAFTALVLAVPFAAASALGAYGELIDAEEQSVDSHVARVQVACSALALVLLVLGAAARAPAVGEGAVPPLATSSLLVCLTALLVQAVVASARQIREPLRIPRPELELVSPSLEEPEVEAARDVA
jgi:hypothetical protein